jgi:hypothetical protein
MGVESTEPPSYRVAWTPNSLTATDDPSCWLLLGHVGILLILGRCRAIYLPLVAVFGIYDSDFQAINLD